jgi:S-adenosylmethionine hydrolase
MDGAKASRVTMNISINMSAKIVTLTTDFGLKDTYAAEMKATILGICSNAVLVDISHEIAKFNVRMGAYMLASAAPYFPKGTIHVAVVDPGVGTQRRPILIQTEQGFFVGPDNGLLILAAEKQGILCVRELANPRFMLPRVSNTFHGRDIFAPAAAHLLNQVKPTEFGSEICHATKPEFARVIRRNDTLIGKVLHVDGFGNIITNISENDMEQCPVEGALIVEFPGHKLKLKLRKAYGDTRSHELLALIGSHGFLEIAANQSSAAEKLKVRIGERVRISIT